MISFHATAAWVSDGKALGVSHFKAQLELITLLMHGSHGQMHHCAIRYC